MQNLATTSPWLAVVFSILFGIYRQLILLFTTLCFLCQDRALVNKLEEWVRSDLGEAGNGLEVFSSGTEFAALDALPSPRKQISIFMDERSNCRRVSRLYVHVALVRQSLQSERVSLFSMCWLRRSQILRVSTCVGVYWVTVWHRLVSGAVDRIRSQAEKCIALSGRKPPLRVTRHALEKIRSFVSPSSCTAKCTVCHVWRLDLYTCYAHSWRPCGALFQAWLPLPRTHSSMHFDPCSPAVSSHYIAAALWHRKLSLIIVLQQLRDVVDSSTFTVTLTRAVFPPRFSHCLRPPHAKFTSRVEWSASQLTSETRTILMTWILVYYIERCRSEIENLVLQLRELRRGAWAEQSRARLGKVERERGEKNAMEQVRTTQLATNPSLYRLRSEAYARVSKEWKCSGERILHTPTCFERECNERVNSKIKCKVRYVWTQLCIL